MKSQTRKHYWFMRFLVLVGVVLILAAGMLYWGARALLCGNDLVDVIPIPASNWELRTETFSCGVFGGSMTILAENKVSHARVELAILGSVYDIGMTVSQDHIVLTIPVDVMFRRYADGFDKYKVTFISDKKQ